MKVSAIIALLVCSTTNAIKIGSQEPFVKDNLQNAVGWWNDGSGANPKDNSIGRTHFEPFVRSVVTENVSSTPTGNRPLHAPAPESTQWYQPKDRRAEYLAQKN